MPTSWSHGRKALSVALPAIPLAMLLAGCDAAARDYPVAIFRPETPGATDIHNLSIILLAIAGVAFVIVEVWLLLAVFRYRNRPEEQAEQIHGNLRLEVGWTAATAFVVLVTLGLTVKTMVDVTTIPTSALPMASAFPGDTLLMRVVGHQWWWTFEYPQDRVVTANEVHVPAGRPIKVQLEADDVIHAFWAPRLGGKTDTIPGQINYTSFVASEQGVYRGICAEFCGNQHAHMGFRIISVPAAQFSEWMRAQQADAAQPTNDRQRAGQQAFQQNCAGCHTVRGTQAQGRMGPDLTHVASRQTLAADMFQLNPENLAMWIRDPQAAKPGNKMPKQNLDQETLDRLVAYLMNLK